MPGKTASTGHAPRACAVGVDIGGSAIKYAVVDDTGKVVWPPVGAAGRVSYHVVAPGRACLTWSSTGEVAELACAPAAGDGERDADVGDLLDGQWVVPAAVAREALLQALRRLAASFRGEVAAVGIGATGLIGLDGVVRAGYAFTGYHGTDWAAVAAQAGYTCPVRVLNDARAAAWAEYARSRPHDGAFLHVTAGTRVGCAVVANGRLLEGADSCAGEFSYQQLIAPGVGRYFAGARLADGLLDDPLALGAALTGVIHVLNPNRIVLHGFAPGLVAAVQAHLDRYVFKTHLRALATVQAPGSGSMAVGPDFLGRLIVCAPLPLGKPGDVYFGEIGGSFGIEADYTARTGRRARFDEIAAAAARADAAAAACLERAATITAAGIVNVCHMTGAQLVTVGGAVPLLYTPYLQIVAEYTAAQPWDDAIAPTILPSAAGNDAGVIGAALYALQRTAPTNG